MSFDPYSELFAEVAQLDDSHAEASLGDETTPADEPLRLENRHSLAFVARSHRRGPREADPRVQTAIFGLLGPIGPLPYFYSEIVAKAERSNELALRNFFDLLSHRATALMYRAWRKSRLTLEHQPGAASERQNKFSRALEGLIGTADMPDRIAWLDIAGSKPLAAPDLFTRRVRNAMGLRQLLRRQFDMPFEIEELVGNWETLPDEARPRLGSGGLRPSLGLNTVLGRRVWQVQSAFRVVIVHPTREQYMQLKPGSESLRRIQLAIRMYCTGELAFKLKIVVSGSAIEAGTLGGKNAPAMLGWNSLSGQPDPDRDYALSISRDYNEERISA